MVTTIQGSGVSQSQVTAPAVLPQQRSTVPPGIYLVGAQRIGIIPCDQAVLMVTLAEDLDAQRDRMTRQADRLAALVAFAGRLREAMVAASSSAVRLDVDPTEEGIATFLITQARARAQLIDRTRYRHDCQICGMSTLSNPEYEKLVTHNRRIDAATRGIGIAFLTGGMASPIVMANSLFAFRRQHPDYHCPKCQAVGTEQTVVVFCPGCKAPYDRPLLKKCDKCRHDLIGSVDLSDVWHAAGAAPVPPPAGTKLSELRLDDHPTMLRFLPDGRRILSASSTRALQLWDVSDPQQGPRSLWQVSVGGLVRGTRPMIALSPDGQWVAVAKPQTPRVRLLRAHDGAEVQQLSWSMADGGMPNDLAFTSDSKALVVGNSNVELWHPMGCRTLRLKLGTMTSPSHVACSRDGRHVAATTASWGSHRLFVWQLADGAPVATIPLGGAAVDLEWHPSSSAVLLGVGSSAVLLRVPDGAVLAEFHLDSMVTAVALSVDGIYVAAASLDRSARVFDLRTQAEVARVSRPAGVTAIAFSADGRLAVGDESNCVQFWVPPSLASAP